MHRVPARAPKAVEKDPWKWKGDCSLARDQAGASKAFYEKLDFKVVGGDAAQNWLILRNGSITVGLFQGMFERNILTFNPGWDHNAQVVGPFTDVREHQRRLKSKGLEPHAVSLAKPKGK